jgi:hypothetical protein
MENGIYHVSFSSCDHPVDGVLVIAGNSVNGGCRGYVCRGSIGVEGTSLSGTLAIWKWDPEAPHSLGLFKEVSLRVNGVYDPQRRSFNFEGRGNGHHVVRIQAFGHFVAPLAYLFYTDPSSEAASIGTSF